MRDSFSQGKDPVQDDETSAFGRLGENHGEANNLWNWQAASHLEESQTGQRACVSGGVVDKYGNR